jgi:hypothetical protein
LFAEWINCRRWLGDSSVIRRTGVPVMGRGWAFGALSLGFALVIGLTGCGNDGGGWPPAKGRASADAAAPARAATPPPGGWPQPEGGRLTEKMCGLLTEADYARFGHRRLPSVSEKLSEAGTNRVDCLYMTNDELWLDLQPTAESARLVLAADFRTHKRRMAQDERQSVLATSVVPGADASWYDYATLGSDSGPHQEHELRLRRGSLLVGITLSGIKGKSEQDPRTVLTGLAALVLQRIPDVGKTDTGRTHKVTYQVLGAGRATSITYSDPTAGKAVTRRNVRLPWRLVLPLGETGRPGTPLVLNAASTAPLASLGCRISVDGRTVAAEPRQGGLVFCQGDYAPNGS